MINDIQAVAANFGDHPYNVIMHPGHNSRVKLWSTPGPPLIHVAHIEGDMVFAQHVAALLSQNGRLMSWDGGLDYLFPHHAAGLGIEIRN